MIYRINDLGKPERLTEGELKSYLEKLKEVFPRSFREQNPEPVKLHFSRKYQRKVDRYDSRSDMGRSGRQVTKMPPVTFVKTIEKVNEKGFGRTYFYSADTIVSDDKGGYMKELKSIAVRPPGISLDPMIDLEKIIFLYFFSSNINDSGRGENKGGYLYFARPDIRAKEEIQKITFAADVYNTFINDKTRISYSDLRKIASAMQIGLSLDENEDRLAMNAKCQESTMWERYKRVAHEVIARNNTNDLSEINEKAKKAKAMNILREKDGKWFLTTAGGEVQREIVEVKGTKADKLLNLIDYLKGDPDTVQKMNDLMDAAEALV